MPQNPNPLQRPTQDHYTVMTEQQPPQPGKQYGLIMQGVAWLILFGLVFSFFQDHLEQQYNPNQSLNQQQQREIVLQRNRYGHYVANGMINGEPVTFLLDTGATRVAMSAVTAARLGIEGGSRSRSQTAAGITTSYLLTLDSVSLGGIQRRDVQAAILPEMPGEEVLLGMSFLKHLELIQKGDQLTIIDR